MNPTEFGKINVNSDVISFDTQPGLKEITKQIDAYDVMPPKINKEGESVPPSDEEKRQALEVIYKDIMVLKKSFSTTKEISATKEINCLIAKVCMRYGQIEYGSDYSKCKNLALKTFAFQCSYLGIEGKYDVTSATLADWAAESDLKAFEQILPTITSDTVKNALKGYSSDQIFVTACTLRQVWYATKNTAIPMSDVKEKLDKTLIDGKPLSEESKKLEVQKELKVRTTAHNNVLKCLYSLGEPLFNDLQKESKTYHEALVDFQYNTVADLAVIKYEEDYANMHSEAPKDKVEILEFNVGRYKAAKTALEIVMKLVKERSDYTDLEILRWQASVTNLAACKNRIPSREKIEELQKVIIDREKIDKAENAYKSGFLLANARNHYTSTVAQFEDRTTEQINFAKNCVAQACQFAEDSCTKAKEVKEKPKNLDYLGVYYETQARLQKVLGEKDAALKSCERAKELYAEGKYDAYIGDVQELIEEIKK